MSRGSMTTAVDLYQLRLGAASARIELADLISRIDGAPHRHQIVAWRDQLTDPEVMERVRDEALAFGREAQLTVER